ncbi:DUF6125 family protein [uncultured Methanoregula sp.]|uniref:DUF6125 family protein n=1 Tax=uncultured Methanoregula sp. TaxID=1005933 RepID=UPI002AABE7E1|nr:DUF6125 family protein [uncultured Methanoregula sp.]
MALIPEDCTKELNDAARNWLAIDGLWFQAVEQEYGMDVAVALDCKVWKEYAAIEARRIKERLGLPEKGGLDALQIAFENRLFSHVNEYEIQRPDQKTLVLNTRTCRVQAARERKKLPPFACKPVGLVEFPVFARTIDARVITECLSCPPELRPGTRYCSWKFTLNETE